MSFVLFTCRVHKLTTDNTASFFLFLKSPFSARYRMISLNNEHESIHIMK